MSEENKIIVDDDFKSQVAAEKEALKKQKESEPESPEGAQPDEMPSMQMPAASFDLLVSTFATEALVALGQIPHPVTQEMSVNPDHASYAIDMLAMLKEKTKGNLTDAEENTLIEVLHQLRMAFIAVRQATPSTPPEA